MSDSIPHLGAGAQRLLEESLGRVGSKLDRRERIGNRFFAGGFLLVALAIAGLRGGQEVSPLLAAAFVIAFAVMAGVVLWGDAVNGTALQIVFVPMLLLLPAEDVPLLAAAGL